VTVFTGVQSYKVDYIETYKYQLYLGIVTTITDSWYKLNLDKFGERYRISPKSNRNLNK